MKVEGALSVGAIAAAGNTTASKDTIFPGIASLDNLEDAKAQMKSSHLSIHDIYQKESGANPLLDQIVENTKSPFPYSHMADDSNIISYNGVTFVGDSETNTLCLGDMSQEENILSIPLSDGGTLRVNRDNIGELAKAIDMFSPKDINRIMKAISLDAKVAQKENEIEAMKLAPFMEEK